MTDTHDALYRAICAHPDEDTPRLAFADLIEEAGDPLRGRFIRTQVALARAPAYDPAWVRARQFEPDAATGWGMAHTLPKVPGGSSWHRFEFRRGFPWKVGVLSLGAFVAAGDAVFDAAPIQALDIDARDRPDLGALADWPHLARLHKLEFSVGWFGAGEIARLAGSEYATALTELGFEFDGIAPDGLTALAASPLFARLHGLELRSNAIPPALLIDSLAAAREPGSLSRLSLPFNRIGRADAEHLFALPLMREVQHLDVSDNPLGTEGVTALAESGVVRGLRTLNLSRTRPGVPGVKALVEAGGLAGLRLLDLSDNVLGPVAVKALAGCAGFRGLRVLNLANNLVGDAGATALAAGRALSGLLELDLRDADVSDEGATALAESPHLGNLLRLDLRARDGRELGPDARAALTARFGDHVSL
ncbi:MAG: TIGR02996 domain-containing protein [Planctomycetes bacterium]|nr:TIGR02996 domain-containing protein [Planctomycetota bacterium]